MPSYRCRVAVVAFLAAAVSLDAQERSGQISGAGGSSQSSSGIVFSGPDGQSGVVLIEPIDLGRPVLNAPYSADAVTEVIQILADGNEIERKTSAAVARDSRGRIRREQPGIAFGGLITGGAAPLVTITDPAAGTHTTLNPDRRLAYRARTSRAMPHASGARGEPVAGTRELVPGASAEARTRTLEARTIEGVRVDGVETTMTIAAGAMGNKRPIHIVSEQWYSPDLKVVVMTRRLDPRFGETRYRLTNIVQKEPPPELFEVPSDFRVVDAPAVPRPQSPPEESHPNGRPPTS